MSYWTSTSYTVKRDNEITTSNLLIRSNLMVDNRRVNNAFFCTKIFDNKAFNSILHFFIEKESTNFINIRKPQV